jgi:3-oxoacyl-[acyl-carrier-protein] synthase-3
MILRRDGEQGPLILGVDAMTLGHLHNAITIRQSEGRTQLIADAVCIEHQVMPIFYLHLFRLANKVLGDHGLCLSDVDHFIYSNISRRDREGFRRMVGLPEGALPQTHMEELGHTFASDLIINYAEMRREGLIRPGQLLLFASAGIGFTWGVTLARV